MILIIAGMSVLFVVLAILNWGQTIGAGPTILIVGALFLIGYIGISYTQYLYDLRVYDACVSRRDRQIENFNFNTNLITVLGAEIEFDPKVYEELKNSILAPMPLSSCGTKPDFIYSGGDI